MTEKSSRKLCAEIEAFKQAAEVARKRKFVVAMGDVRQLIAEFSFSSGA